MSDITQKDIWALELSNYFIKKHKYQLMTLNKETQEMWLIHPSHDYPILMISTLTTDSFNKDELRLHRHALSMLLKSKADGINFSVNKDSTFSDAQNIIVSDEGVSNDSVLNTFKDLDHLLKPSSNLGLAMNKVAQSIQKNMTRLQKVNALQSNKVTLILSVILSIFFGLTYYIGIKYEMNFTETLLVLGAYYKPLIVIGHQYWRLITPMLLHGSFLHLFMNLIAMRNLGSILERELGSWRYLFTIITGVLFGSIFVFIRNENTIAIGISAGIYALLGILLVYLFEKDLLKNKMVLMNVMSTLMINLYISLMPNVSMTGHLGGLYAGVLLGFIFSKRKDWAQIRLYTKIFFAMSVVLLAYLMIQNANILF